MKIIYTSKMQEILVDDEDYERMNQHAWFCDSKGYARRMLKVSENRNSVTVSMHREIMDAPKGMVVDHKNHEPLDNQKHNLRICTYQENRRNHGVSKNNISGASGVNWNESSKKWYASIGVDNRNIFLGSFNTVEKAFEIRKKAEEEYFGEFKNNLIDFELFAESKKKKGSLLRSDNKSGITGVFFVEARGIWTSSISINKKHIYLGDFHNFEDAKKARIDAEIKYFGESYTKDLILDERLIELSKNKKVKQKCSVDYKLSKKNISGMTGVGWIKKTEKWIVKITFEGKSIYLGCYADLEEAKQVRTEAELKHYGRTAEDNDIEQY